MCQVSEMQGQKSYFAQEWVGSDGAVHDLRRTLPIPWLPAGATLIEGTFHSNVFSSPGGIF